MIQTRTINGYRFYRINGEYYPSVTSVLSIIPHPALEKRKQSLTPAQVEEILKYTSSRGSLVHYGALRQYETSEIIQDELEQESINFLKQHPQMKQEIDIVGRLFREFTQLKGELSSRKLKRINMFNGI